MILVERLKSGWNVLKIIRVLLGVLILSSSIAEGNPGGIVLGSLFTALSLLTDGVCCAGSVCDTHIKQNKRTLSEKIEYEELGH